MLYSLICLTPPIASLIIYNRWLLNIYLQSKSWSEISAQISSCPTGTLIEISQKHLKAQHIESSKIMTLTSLPYATLLHWSVTLGIKISLQPEYVKSDQCYLWREQVEMKLERNQGQNQEGQLRTCKKYLQFLLRAIGSHCLSLRWWEIIWKDNFLKSIQIALWGKNWRIVRTDVQGTRDEEISKKMYPR